MTLTHRRNAAIALLAALAFFIMASVVQATHSPDEVITLADVEKAAGGKWNSRSPEPGVIFYEEEGGGYRQINVYLFPPDGKTVAAIRDAAVQNGEEVEKLDGLGDDAMYRAQSREATVEKAGKDGPQLLSVSVLEVPDPAKAKQLAIELIRRGLAKL
jgi:hypothetical protein